MKTIYIAGPMTGLPDFNYPAFNAKASLLRKLGYDVVNPAEFQIPDPAKTWKSYMREAIRQLSRADGIYLLRDWTESKGARLEARIAIDLGMGIFLQHMPATDPSMRAAVIRALSGEQA